MIDTNYIRHSLIRTAVAAVLAIPLVAGCASAPQAPAGALEVRERLTVLQGDPVLATLAPVATKDAETAVAAAQVVQPDPALAAHRVYIAVQKVDTARALAETRFAESERATLSKESEKARLDARTREADLARNDAVVARAENAQQTAVATQARTDADAAQMAASNAEQQAAELKRQLEELQARPTDRGLVLTLGDTLFATGKAELKTGATGNLDRVTAFLNQYPARTASIEGFTDSMGTEESNQDLSQRRADSVKRYLVAQGVGSARLTTAGRGENAPVADNDSAAGRQQNRRVEVVISQASSPSGATN